MSASASVRERLLAAMPFLVVAALAITAAGITAAVVAHAPTQPLIWMIAYLILVVGVAQAALGSVQASMSRSPLPVRFRLAQFLLFNAGNAGVIVGTLSSSWLIVLAGTLLFAAALAMFLYSSWKCRGGWLLHVYRVLLTILFTGSIVGLALSATRHLH